MERTERIELTPEELDRERQAAVQEGGERVAEELEQRLLAAVPDLAACLDTLTIHILKAPITIQVWM